MAEQNVERVQHGDTSDTQRVEETVKTTDKPAEGEQSQERTTETEVRREGSSATSTSDPK